MNSKIFTPIVFLAAAGIIFYSGVQQQISAVQNLRAHVQNAGVALKQAQGGDEEQNKLVSDWQNLSAAIKDRIDLGVPSGEDLPNLILLLNNTAVGSGLSVENIAISEAAQNNAATRASSSVVSSPATPPQGGALKNVLVTIHAEGGYPSIKAFVESIQKGERIMDVQTVDITPFTGTVGTAKAGNIFDMTMSVKAYYR